MPYLMDLLPGPDLGEIFLGAIGTVLSVIIEGIMNIFNSIVNALVGLSTDTPYPEKNEEGDPQIFNPDGIKEGSAWDGMHHNVYEDVALPYAVALFVIAAFLAYFGKLLENLPSINISPDFGRIVLYFLVSVAWFPIMSAFLVFSDSLGDVLSLDYGDGGAGVGECSSNEDNGEEGVNCPSADFSNAQAIGKVALMLILLFFQLGLFLAAFVFWVIRYVLVFTLGAIMPLSLAFLAFDEVDFPFLGTIGQKMYDWFWFVTFINVPAALIVGIGGKAISQISQTVIEDAIGVEFMASLAGFLIEISMPLVAFLSPFYFLISSSKGQKIMSMSSAAVSGGATAAAGAASGTLAAAKEDTDDIKNDDGGRISSTLRGGARRAREGFRSSTNTMVNKADNKRFEDALKTAQRGAATAEAVGGASRGQYDSKAISEEYEGVDEDTIERRGEVTGAVSRFSRGEAVTGSDEAQRLSRDQMSKKAIRNPNIDTEGMSDAEAAAAGYMSDETTKEYEGNFDDVVEMLARTGVDEEDIRELEKAGYRPDMNSINRNSERIKDAGILDESEIEDIRESLMSASLGRDYKETAIEARQNSAVDTSGMSDAEAAAAGYSSNEVQSEYLGDEDELVEMLAKTSIDENDVLRLEDAGYSAKFDDILENSESLKKSGILSKGDIRDVQELAGKEEMKSNVEDFTRSSIDVSQVISDEDSIQPDVVDELIEQSEASSMDDLLDLTAEDIAEQTDFSEGLAGDYLSTVKAAQAYSEMEGFDPSSGGPTLSEDEAEKTLALLANTDMAKFGGSKEGVNIENIQEADSKEIAGKLDDKPSFQERRETDVSAEVKQDLLRKLDDINENIDDFNDEEDKKGTLAGVLKDDETADLSPQTIERMSDELAETIGEEGLKEDDIEAVIQNDEIELTDSDIDGPLTEAVNEFKKETFETLDEIDSEANEQEKQETLRKFLREQDNAEFNEREINKMARKLSESVDDGKVDTDFVRSIIENQAEDNIKVSVGEDIKSTVEKASGVDEIDVNTTIGQDNEQTRDLPEGTADTLSNIEKNIKSVDDIDAEIDVDRELSSMDRSDAEFLQDYIDRSDIDLNDSNDMKKLINIMKNIDEGLQTIDSSVREEKGRQPSDKTEQKQKQGLGTTRDTRGIE